ncbi:hypothetical protein FHE66_07700 [Georgenia sp. 311]|uniref:Cupin n=1 Tax=Georgenia wutianyii TaxID=2585135 RepID=A0ABX5VQE7_9MICO|nr:MULTISPECIES: hypothetical protein [Georgenia]QDB80475.1 hypothetical protein FE251_14660 [Georgenia wutianyii]TNC18313.1 hypothetical protein FHE66_07700 [Georgenia sp. 311]
MEPDQTTTPLTRVAAWARAALARAAQDHRVTLGEAPEADGLAVRTGLLRAGDRVGLAAADEEIWVVVDGHVELLTTRADLAARTGDVLHVPVNTPGHLVAVTDTRFVAVAFLGP